jgi:hypothetical protein
MKRTPPAMGNEDDPQLLPSQKRARIIEAVLREGARLFICLSETNRSYPRNTRQIQLRPHSDNELLPEPILPFQLIFLPPIPQTRKISGSSGRNYRVVKHVKGPPSQLAARAVRWIPLPWMVYRRLGLSILIKPGCCTRRNGPSLRDRRALHLF